MVYGGGFSDDVTSRLRMCPSIFWLGFDSKGRQGKEEGGKGRGSEAQWIKEMIDVRVFVPQRNKGV